MSFNQSSMIGADFNTTSTTALFALLTPARGSDNSEWVYAHSNTAHTTGQILALNSVGTGINATTAAATSGTYSFGFVPSLAWTAGDYGWLCTRGNNVYAQMSGTAVPNTQLYIANTPGALTTNAASGTMMGVELIVSSSTASLVVTTAILTWPRSVPALG